MPQLPSMNGREVVRAFEKHGWEVARQRGSHIIMVKTAQNVTAFNSGPQRSGQTNTAKPDSLSRADRSAILFVKRALPLRREELAGHRGA
jgi:predicted RNA binding protein YcfA (HicA-like mRNA interferase family)